MPVVPVDDAGTWDPLQVIEVKVKDGIGQCYWPSTQATVPTSDEINCAKCHAGGSSSTFTNILQAHDDEEGTTLFSQQPVLCAKCHGSPALGTIRPRYIRQIFISGNPWVFMRHEDAACYDCHPGSSTRCSRSLAHMGTTDDGNCTTCHGYMAKCGFNHNRQRENSLGQPNLNASLVIRVYSALRQIGQALYRNSGPWKPVLLSMSRKSCMSMYPSREAKDNYQPDQYQGR